MHHGNRHTVVCENNTFPAILVGNSILTFTPFKAERVGYPCHNTELTCVLQLLCAASKVKQIRYLKFTI